MVGGEPSLQGSCVSTPRAGGRVQVAGEVEVGMGQRGNGKDAGCQDRAGKQANSWVCAVSPPAHSCSGSAQD